MEDVLSSIVVPPDLQATIAPPSSRPNSKATSTRVRHHDNTATAAPSDQKVFSHLSVPSITLAFMTKLTLRHGIGI
eukprot:scaffold265074_cov28-Tisochrysis_lutea.AAC.6